MKRALVLALGVAVMTLALLPQPGSAQGPGPSAGELLASGLSTTGATIGPDGALYIAQPGTGGDIAITLPADLAEEFGTDTGYFGFTGSVARVDPETGEVTTAASGLPSGALEHGGEGAGATDVAFIGDTMYVLMAGGHNYVGGAAADSPNGVYRYEGDDEWTVIVDLSEFNDENPVAFGDAAPGGNPFSFTPRGSGFIISDGNYNRVLHAGVDGSVDVLVTFDNVVPTGTESGTSGPVFITQFSAFPHAPGSSKLQQIGYPTGNTVDLATGTQLIDVEIGPGGKLYVLSFGEPSEDPEGPPAVPGSGAIQVLDGGELKTVVSGFFIPTSLDIIGDTAFVSGLTGDVYKVDGLSGIEPQEPAPQPTAAPAPSPTRPAGVVRPPDTGTGGASSGSASVLLLAGLAALVVAGGAVTLTGAALRRSR
jgi:hypothetical protein